MVLSRLEQVKGTSSTTTGPSAPGDVVGEEIDLTADAGPTVNIDAGTLPEDVTSQVWLIAETVTEIVLTPPPTDQDRKRLVVSFIGGDPAGCAAILFSGTPITSAVNGFASRELAVVDPGAGVGGPTWVPADFYQTLLSTDYLSDFTSSVNAIVGFEIALHVAAVDPHGDRAYTDGKAVDRSVTTGSSGQRKIVAGNPTNAIAASINIASIHGGGQTNYENVIGAASTANVGTASSNLPTVASGGVANYSVILGGYDNVANALVSVIGGAHNYTDAAADHATITGGSFHKITAGSYGTISGGTANTVSNSSATVAGGTTNTASGLQGTVAGGSTNTASGQGSSVGGGLSNVASGTYTFAVGRSNTASSPYSRATGYQARAYTEGMVAHASGRFAADGDAQASRVHLRCTTTDATPTILGPAGAAAHHQMQEPATCTFFAVVTARQPTTGDSKGWVIQGVAKNNSGGSVTIVDAVTKTVLGDDAGAATWDVNVATGSNSLGLTGTGEAAKTIRWFAYFTMAEVGG